MRFRRLLPAISAILIAVLFVEFAQAPRLAEAHPLGNFSVNRLVILDLDRNGLVRVRYVIDAAEIPTFQSLSAIDTDGDGSVGLAEETAYLNGKSEDLVRGLVLEIDGRRVPLTTNTSDLEVLEGQGGLQTMRIVVNLDGELHEAWQDGVAASFRDENYGGEPGWRQVVVRPGVGVSLFKGEVTTTDVTAELTVYPQDLLKSPPGSSEASFSFRRGAATSVPAAVTPEGPTVSRDAAGKTLGRFASIVSRENVTPGFVLIALLLAAGWGAMHALGPGHGKTVVAAYLIGERGTWRHALYLGLIVTATHTISVFALGAIAIFASNVFSADDVYHWLSIGSGSLVALLGGFLLATRLRRLQFGRNAEARGHQSHGHEHPHHRHSHQHGEHDHDHGHSHVPTAPGWRGLVALGISGGLVPCPTALVVMLGAIAIGRTAYGLVLVAAFSLGLAGVLTGIGLLMVYGQHLLAGSRVRPLLNTRLVRSMTMVSPVLSALAILSLGLVLAGRATL